MATKSLHSLVTPKSILISISLFGRWVLDGHANAEKEVEHQDHHGVKNEEEAGCVEEIFHEKIGEEVQQEVKTEEKQQSGSHPKEELTFQKEDLLLPVQQGKPGDTKQYDQDALRGTRVIGHEVYAAQKPGIHDAED